MTKNKDIRIIFCLDEPLDSLFNAAARKEGVSKSKLIRGWLENLEDFKAHIHTPGKRNKYYNLYLDRTVVKKIDEVARRYGKSRSNFLYYFLHQKLSQPRSSRQDESLDPNQLRTAWTNGEFGNAVDHIGDRIDLLSPESQTLYAKILIEMGKLNDAQSLISHIEQILHTSVDPTRVQAHIYILKTRLYRIQRELSKSNTYAQEALRIGETIKDREIIALAHYRLGVLALGQERFDDAIYQFERSLEYLDIQNYPLHYVQVYFSMTYCYTYKKNYAIYLKYLNRTKEILAIHPNYYYEAVICHAELVTSYLNGIKVNAEEISNKGIELAHKSGSVLSIHDHYEVRGMMNFINQSAAASVHDLEQALALELKYKPDNDTSYAYVMKTFLESRYNFDRALPRIERLMHKCNEEGVHVKLREHLVNGMKYLYSKNKAYIEEGRKNLVLLSEQGDTQLLKAAARNILEKRQLYLVE